MDYSATSWPSILEFPGIRIDQSRGQAKLESGVIRMIRRVRPDWPKEDIILQRFNEGFSNILYGGYTDRKEDMILVKVYGDESSNKSRELFSLRLLASRRFGSQLYATFTNGHVYEYSPGVPLHYDLCIDQHIFPAVARRVGELHRDMRDQMGPWDGPQGQQLRGKPGGHIFDTLRDWLKQVPLQLADPESNRRMKRELPSRSALERELDELEHVLNRPDRNPVLFCHGDLNPANLIFDPIRRSIVFIDLEFAGPNFQGFEIAQHFMTFVGGNLDRVGRQEFVPAKEFQLRWCQNYLAGFQGQPFHKIPDSEVRNLYVVVQKFSLVFLLQEIIWSLVRVDRTSIPGFDILQYGVQRFQQYHRNKYNILQLQG